MIRRAPWSALPALTLALVACAGGGASAPETTAVRVAYFPNIAHATAIVGLARGTFQEALGPRVKVRQKALNAGPEVVEGLFAGTFDIAYLGPNPAVNGYVRSEGQALRIVAGAALGGAAFIVRRDSGIESPGDLPGKRIATPGIGNTQDVALRSYLQRLGLKTAELGGPVHVIPLKNPDILTLFQKGQIHGAWVPEPWATRLLHEAQGRLFVDERDLWPDGRFAATVVAVRPGFLKHHPDLVERWLAGHVRSTQWVRSHPAEAQALFNQEVRRILGKGLPDRVLREAWPRLVFESQVPEEPILEAARQAHQVGYLGHKPLDLRGLIVREPLERAPHTVAAPLPEPASGTHPHSSLSPPLTQRSLTAEAAQ